MTYPTPNWKPRVGELACMSRGRTFVTDLAHNPDDPIYTLKSAQCHGASWSEDGKFDIGFEHSLDLVEPTPEELNAFHLVKSKSFVSVDPLKKREIMVTVKFTNEELTAMMLKAAGAPEGITSYELQNAADEPIQFGQFQLKWWTTEGGQE